MPYLRAIRYRLLKWARVVIHSNDSPRQIAGGAALGIFWACNPTVISQGLFAVITATVCRCSRIPAFAMTFVSNPLTAVPIYGTGYMIGRWLVRLLGFQTPMWREVRHVFMKLDDLTLATLRTRLGEAGHLGWGALVTMEVGATVLGLILAGVAYYFALRFVTGHRLLKAQRMALRAKRRLERVRAQQALEHASPAGEAPHD